MPIDTLIPADIGFHREAVLTSEVGHFHEHEMAKSGKPGNSDKPLNEERIRAIVREEQKPPSGFRKVMLLLREWGFASGLITVIMGLLALLVAVGNLAYSRMDRLEQKMDARLEKIDGRIDKIDAALRSIQVSLASNEMKNLAGLQPPEFARKLPEVASTMMKATSLRIPTPPEVLTSLQKNLVATDEQRPGYWPAVSEFVNYRSFQVSPSLAAQRLPRCYDRAPKYPKEHPRLMGPFEYEKCLINLQEPLPRLLELILTPHDLLKGFGVTGYFNLVCYQCVVTYAGGPIPAPLGAAVFEDCLFVLAIAQPPPPRGRQIAKILLEAGPARVEIPKG